MSKGNANISIESKLKQEAVKMFSQLGLDFSIAITLFHQQFVRE